MAYPTVFTATDLKNNTSSILGEVVFSKKEVIIERHGKPIAKIVPLGKSKKAIRAEDALKKYFGIFPDFPAAEKIRKSRVDTRKIPTL